MCGIIGAVGNQNIVDILMYGLRGLEYRGYDSAGIAIINNHQHLERVRTLGKMSMLEKEVERQGLSGKIGIAHTRWATHGAPSVENAHPHVVNNKVAIVHNGIIENHQLIREQLLQDGCVLESETDSELIAHLIYQNINSGMKSLDAVRHIMARLDGAFAVAVMIVDEPNHLIALRKHSSLVIGIGMNGHYVASDSLVLNKTNKIIYLEDGDIADVYQDNVILYNEAGKKIERRIHTIEHKHDVIDKGHFSHYMLKEIYEQPEAVSAVLEGRLTSHEVFPEAFGYNAASIFSRVRRVHIVGCGTSYHAGLVAKYWLESIANIPCQVEIASEYRYRKQPIEADTLFVTLSQSGETADTLAALRLAKSGDYLCSLAICNVANSTMVRESDLILMTNAGAEIGVASTKAFTTQLISLLLLTLALAPYHHIKAATISPLLKEMLQLPDAISNLLKLDHKIKTIAEGFVDKHHCLYIARGIEFPIALEGALKLKEISYIHAEAIPAGELKHGTLALIDEQMLVVALAPHNDLFDKISSNLEVIMSRHGKLLVLSDSKAIKTGNHLKLLTMPSCHRYIAPILYTIPLQLLAYYVAVLKGNDVDQPRNLAKSVTVE